MVFDEHNFRFRTPNGPGPSKIELVCHKCGEGICTVEPLDNLGDVVNAASDHVNGGNCNGERG